MKCFNEINKCKVDVHNLKRKKHDLKKREGSWCRQVRTLIYRRRAKSDCLFYFGFLSEL